MKLRALVIDDSRVMRNMVMATLRRCKSAEFDFIEAEDGMDGIAKFDPKALDIVFADWNMPRMTGIDFVRRVRTMPAADHIPIIMVTSERTVGKMDEALGSAGANAFISKPFTPDEMEQKLQSVLQANTAAAASKPKAGGFFGKLAG